MLDRILVQPGDKVPVGTPLATLRRNGAAQEPKPAPPQPPPEVPSQPEPSPPAPPPERPYEPPPAKSLHRRYHPRSPPAPANPPVEIPEPEAGGGVRVRMTPAARRRAAELGLDPGTVRGTGPNGAVSLVDLEVAARRAPLGQLRCAPRPGFDPAEMQGDRRRHGTLEGA